MNRCGVTGESSGDDIGDVHVALCTRGFANTHGFIGKLDMERVAIDCGMHGDRGDSHLFAGPNNPECDFSSVGNQNLTELHKWRPPEFLTVCKRLPSTIGRLGPRCTESSEDFVKGRSIALNFLRDGLSIEAVARGTGLSVEEVQLLQQELNLASAL